MIWADGLTIGEIIVSRNGLLHWRKIQKELSVLEDLVLSVMTDTQIINLGYRFSIKWWGKGLATELAKYVVSYGISILKLAEISSVVRPNHLASQKLLIKAGLRYVRDIHNEKNEPASMLFTLTLDEWNNTLSLDTTSPINH